MTSDGEWSGWDELAGRDQPLAQRRFADCVERGGLDAQFDSFLRAAPSGELLIAAELARLDVSLDLLSPSPLRGVVARARRLWPSFLRVPVTFAGLPASFGQPGVRLATRLSAAGHDDHVLALVDALESQAESWNTPLVCAKEFTTAEADALANPFESRGFLRLPSLPGVRLELADSFSAYRASMRHGYRRQLDADLAAREALTLRRVQPWGAEVETLYALYEQVMDRAPYQLERFGRGFFDALASAYASDSVALVVEDADGALATAIVLYGERTAVFLLAGIDYGRAEPLRAYPALVVSVIEDAIRRECEAIELGQTSYALKTRLGGVPTDRWLFLKARAAWLQAALSRVGPVLFPAVDVPPRRVFRSQT